MKRASKWLLFAPFAIAAVILLAWYGVWRAGADAMGRALSEFALAETERGVAVTYGPMRAKGFPFFLRGEINQFSIERGAYRFESDVVYLHATPWALQRIVFSTGTALRLSTPGGALAINASGARASIEAAGDNWLFKAEAETLEGLSGQTALKTGRALINIAPDPADKDAYAISARILDARLKTRRGEALIVRLDAALTAQEGSRQIVVHGADGDFGGARLAVSGALGADADGYLVGELAASIDNPAKVAEAFRVFGAIKPEEARAVEAGLGLLAVAGGGHIAAPLVFADGETRLAGAKIARAPRIGQP